MAMSSMSNIGQIVKREVKSYFESPVAYVFLIVFLVLIGFLTFSVARYYEQGVADLRSFFVWHPWVYLLLVPAVSMRLWAEERRSGTIELLLTLPITLPQAILGKFLAAWAFLGIGVLLTTPIVITTALLGDPDAGVVFSGYLGSLLMAGAYLAIGMWASALTRNQVISFVVAVVLCLFLVMAGWPPVTDLLVRRAPAFVVDAVAGISVMTHYESMQRGVLDLRDVTYFLSVMVAFLFGTHLTLDNRKAA